MNYALPTGFTFRPPTWEDLPAAVKLMNDFSEQYLGYRGFTENAIDTEWKTPKFNPETDIRMVFTPEGEMVGYIEVWTVGETPAHPWVWARVHPDYEGRGIGSYLMKWGEERARKALDLCPEDVRVAYRAGTVTTIEAPKALYNSYGMQLIRHSFRMKIDFNGQVPEPNWADGITVQSASKTDKDIETITRVDMEAFKDHFGYIEQPFEVELEWWKNWLGNDEQLADSSLWFLAMDGDQAVGLALCAVYDSEDRELGHVNSLGVLRSHRKRGIGLALLRHAFGEYYRRGYKGATLGVDAENLTGALRLYEKAGMSVHRQFDLYEKELRPGKEISVSNAADLANA
jgi:ribosomal protein S18 acetylase RimI-like enzyme